MLEIYLENEIDFQNLVLLNTFIYRKIIWIHIFFFKQNKILLI